MSKPVNNIAGAVRALTFAALLVVAGCASVPEPRSELGAADSAIAQAAAAGAGQFAPDDLRNARVAHARARRHVQQGDNLLARRAAEKALSLAEVAQALARAERAELAADKAENDLARLRRRLQNQAEGTP